MKRYINFFIFSLLFLFSFTLNSYSEINKNSPLINIIKIDGGINPGSADFIINSIKKAEENNAECLIIELNTPGGAVNSTRTIVQGILNSKVPVVVYVSPSGAHAGSAGTFITLAGHIAAMSPGTNIGAAHPVLITGQDPPDIPIPTEDNKKSTKDKDKDSKNKQPKKEALSSKIENDLSAFIETIAEQRGRNKEWAIKAVRESSSITERKALEYKVIDLIAKDTEELIKKIHNKTVKLKHKTVKLNTNNAVTVRFEMSFKQKFIDFLSTPDVVYILMAIGMLGIYFELSNPGLILPGVAGAIALLLAFVAFQILPFNTAGLIFMLLALILFIAEMYIPTMGILGGGGILSFILGSILLFDTPLNELRLSQSIMWGTILAVSAFVILCIVFIARAYKKKKFLNVDNPLIGELATVYEEISQNKGKIFVHGEYWNAVSEEVIPKGEKVKIVALDGLIAKVIKI